MTISAEQALDPVDRHQYEQALTSLYATGLELKTIASCGPRELRAVLMPHVAEIERVMENIRASMQPEDVAEPIRPTAV
jgi:hypothetical protein